MAQPGPGPSFVIRDGEHIYVKIWHENHLLTHDAAEQLANSIYDALGIEHVAPPSSPGQLAYEKMASNDRKGDLAWRLLPDDAKMEWEHKANQQKFATDEENISNFVKNRDLFNREAIAAATAAATTLRSDDLNTALILANGVAAVMNLHGFPFEQAMAIMEAVEKKAGE